MNYYLREINRSFADFVLLGILEDKTVPGIGESHEGLALAHGCSTLDGIRWREGDGRQLNGDEFESRHLGKCKLIKEEEAQRVIIESKQEIKFKALSGFSK